MGGSANFELCHISSICRLRSTDATQNLVSAFVFSHLNYCSYLLSGCPQYLLNYKKFKATPFTLSWEFPKLTISVILLLPTGCRLIHECSTNSLCYNCLNLTTPVYLTKLTVYKPTCQLHSCSDAYILCLPSWLAWSESFVMLHHLSGTVSLTKLDHQTLVFQISPLQAILLTFTVCAHESLF